MSFCRRLPLPKKREHSQTQIDASNAFVPPNLSVVSGTTVTWTNTDDAQHTVSSDDGHSFESSAFGQNQTFQVTAGAPGTYTYTCRIHPFMHGTLMVTAQ